MKKYECSVTPTKKIPGFKEKITFTKELTYDEIRHCIIHGAKLSININHGMSQIITDLHSLDKIIKLVNAKIGIASCGTKVSKAMEDIITVPYPTNADDDNAIEPLKGIINVPHTINEDDDNVVVDALEDVIVTDIENAVVLDKSNTTEVIESHSETWSPCNVTAEYIFSNGNTGCENNSVTAESVSETTSSNSNQPKNNNNNKKHHGSRHRR